uniref:Uncharacterized protein n=1 Tax=viral metagenome TaxID=1070528 RepID=A0A6C0JY99_9ZZZZ
MAYLRFFQPTRQGEAARDVDTRFEEVSHGTQSGCGNGWATSAMAGNPGMVGRGNFGNSPEGGCAIDTQTRLLFGDPGTSRQHGPKQVFPRPYSTTPFLGLGSVEGIPDQNKVVYGHSTANRKSIQTVTDKPFPVFWPLIPDLVTDFAEYGANVTKVTPGAGRGYATKLEHHNRVDLS